MAPLLKVENLKVSYRLRNRDLTAVNGVSFSVERAQAVGLVGESGSGKTTVALAVLRLLPANGNVSEGRVTFDDMELITIPEEELARIRWEGISMVPQNSMSSLSPAHRVGKVFRDVLRAHFSGSEEEVDARISRAVELANFPKKALEFYPHQMSGGMRQRALIALSMLCQPKLVIADEPTTALDVIVQKQIMDEMKDLRRRVEASLMIITHDIGIVSEYCDIMVVMYAGMVFEYGPTEEVIHDPRSPYTKLLLKSHPLLFDTAKQIVEIPGDPPELERIPVGCPFVPRCPYAQSICKEAEPPLAHISGNHFARCHFV